MTTFMPRPQGLSGVLPGSGAGEEISRRKYKICLVGDAAVGKTSLIRRFVYNDFDDKYLLTLGTRISKKTLTIKDDKGRDFGVNLIVWDIMGQKGFRELLRDAYFYGAKGILAVCDVTRRETLESLEGWLSDVNTVTGKVPILFLGNKADLKEKVQVSPQDLGRAAGAHGSPWFLTSAKTGESVEETFAKLAMQILAREWAQAAAAPAA
jgi:small GTP-binding protein